MHLDPRARILGALSAVSAASLAAGAPTAAVSEIPGAVVVDIDNSGGSMPWGPFAVETPGGTVTVSFATKSVSTGVVLDPAQPGTFQFPTDVLPSWYGSVDPTVNPGDFRGRFNVDRILFITFDPPVSGAGCTLMSDFINSMSEPVRVEAFTGPLGTGTNLGTITTPDNPTDCCPISGSPPYRFLNFAGHTAAPGSTIGSLTLTPLDPASSGWGVDVIAVAEA